jgi:plasmid stabilization system protein ParE
MSHPVVLRTEAETDIEEIVGYLEQFGRAQSFSDRLNELFLRLESHPDHYGYVWQDVRGVRLRKFQYVVYYVAFVDRVEVLAVLHGARHESTWQSRVPDLQ